MAPLAIAAATATVALAGCAPTPTASPSTGDGKITGDLVFSVYPGIFQDNYVKAVVEPFLAAHPDVRIQYVTAPTSAQVLAQLQGQKANPTVDVALMDLAVARTANAGGVFAPLDEKLVPNIADLAPDAKIEGNYGAAITYDTISLLYNPTKVSDKPDSWNALWDDPTAKGSIAIAGPPDLSSTVGLSTVVTKMEGGDYTKSIDPGIEKLKQLAPRVQTWAPQPDQYTVVENGTANFGVGYNARAQYYAKASGGKLAAVLPKEGSFVQINTINLVKGGPNPAAAQAFINYALSPEAQAAFTAVLPYAPTNTKTKLADDILAMTPAADPSAKESLMFLDWDVVAKSRDGWAKQFKQEVVGG